MLRYHKILVKVKSSPLSLFFSPFFSSLANGETAQWDKVTGRLWMIAFPNFIFLKSLRHVAYPHLLSQIHFFSPHNFSLLMSLFFLLTFSLLLTYQESSFLFYFLFLCIIYFKINLYIFFDKYSNFIKIKIVDK